MAVLTGSITSSSTTTQTPTTAYSTPYTIGPTALKATFGNGTAADQITLQYINTLNLAGAAQTLDLTSLLDPLGGAVSFAKVRVIRIRTRATTDGQALVLSGGASNPWTGFLNGAGTFTIQASTAANPAWFTLDAPNTAGMAVSGTSKTLKFDPGANTYQVDIEIYGA